MATAIGQAQAGGAYIVNSFFHCHVVTFREYKSLTALAGFICIPPKSIKQGPMQTVAALSLLVGNLPLVSCLLQVLCFKSKRNNSSVVAVDDVGALKLNFFFGY